MMLILQWSVICSLDRHTTGYFTHSFHSVVFTNVLSQAPKLRDFQPAYYCEACSSLVQLFVNFISSLMLLSTIGTRAKRVHLFALDSVHCSSPFTMSIWSYFKLKGDLPDPEGSLSTCLPIGAKKGVEKAIVDKKPWQKARSLHYSHGTLGYSKLFRTLPCSSQVLSF